MIIGILGSGFGLYGYLPAILKHYSTFEVLILHKSLTVLESRSDLKKYIPFIKTVHNREVLISKCDFLIVAYPPNGVELLFKNLVLFERLNKILIEKPIALTTQNSIKLVNNLNDIKIHVCSGFNFMYTEWNDLLFTSKIKKININWSFKLQQNWKNNINDGGGALRMYGIHFIPILLMNDLISYNITQNTNLVFQGTFKLKHKEINIKIDSTSKINVFEIDNLYKNETPFGLNNHQGIEDNRIKVLCDLFKDFDRFPSKLNSLLLTSLNLLEKIERQ